MVKVSSCFKVNLLNEIAWQIISNSVVFELRIEGSRQKKTVSEVNLSMCGRPFYGRLLGFNHESLNHLDMMC